MSLAMTNNHYQKVVLMCKREQKMIDGAKRLLACDTIASVSSKGVIGN